MKKLIYFLTFSLFTIISHAQINLENNYPAFTGMTKLTNSGYKYYLMDVTKGHIISNYLVDQSLSNLQINLRELTPGIYFYKMSWVGGHGGKFIVK